MYATTNGWTETGITWNSAPAPGILLANTGALKQNTWVAITLPVSAFSGSQTYTLVLAGKPTQSAYFASRESSNQPQLILSVAGGGGTGSGQFPWPGGMDVATSDSTGAFGGNLSGLAYEGAMGSAPAVLWAVRNGPGTLFRLLAAGPIWASDAANGWGNGKSLRYPNGTGSPDAEGVTFAGAALSDGVYVATERDPAAPVETASFVSIRHQPGPR